MPRVLDCRKAFYRAYCQVYEDWAADPIHDTSAFDSAKCDHFISLSIRRLEGVVSRHDKYFLFDCVRTFPLSALKYVCDDAFDNLALDLVRVLSTAILTAAPAGAPGKSWRPASLVLPDNVWIEQFVVDLGTLFGCAYAILHGQQSYRLAAKGGRIKRPRPSSVPLDLIFRDFRKTALFVVSNIAFEDDPKLQFCAHQYDERRRSEGLGVSGFPSEDEPFDAPGIGRHVWWTLTRLPPEFRLSVRINLGQPPNNRMIIESSSYLAFPVKADFQYQLLQAFPEECRSRLGFDPQTLSDLCDALAMTLWRQSCYDRLLPILGEKFTYDCDLSIDPRRKTAPRIIHAINGKAIVVFLESHLIEHLSQQLAGNGYTSKDGRALAGRFVRQFSRLPAIAHALEPILFVPLGGRRLGVDLLHMREYHELCWRTVLSADGSIGERKGALFEDLARSFIIRALRLPRSALPVQPNTEMRKLVPGAVDYGDVDFAFMVGSTLVHLDMKSSCRNSAEFRGDYHAVNDRAKDLRKKMVERVEPRGNQLATHLRERGMDVQVVLNLLCVGVAEYIPPGFPELRYGDIPRALTPRELVSLIEGGDLIDLSARDAFLRC